MNEEDIKNIIESNSISELLNKISRFYPNGFDINKIPKGIKEKIELLENRYAKYNTDLEEISRLNKKT